MPKWACRALAIGFTAVGLMAATTPTALAHSASGATHSLPAVVSSSSSYPLLLENSNTGRCVDDSFANGLRAYLCNSLSYQYFYLNQQSSGWTVVVNQNTGRCVDDSYQYGLRSFGCNGQNYQLWWVTGNGDGTITFQNYNTGRCIDDSFGYGLRAYPCNGLNYQRFYPYR